MSDAIVFFLHWLAEFIFEIVAQRLIWMLQKAWEALTLLPRT